MGWLSRLFPGSKKEEPGVTAVPIPAGTPAAAAAAGVAPAKVGLNGEFDESGMAKRVALAFDEDNELDDVDTLWVAQLSSKVCAQRQSAQPADPRQDGLCGHDRPMAQPKSIRVQ